MAWRTFRKSLAVVGARTFSACRAMALGVYIERPAGRTSLAGHPAKFNGRPSPRVRPFNKPSIIYVHGRQNWLPLTNAVYGPENMVPAEGFEPPTP